MCGILALILGHIGDDPNAPCKAATDLHHALYFLQHRGQDACGIATAAAGGRIYQCKGNGMQGQRCLQKQRKSNSESARLHGARPPEVPNSRNLIVSGSTAVLCNMYILICGKSLTRSAIVVNAPELCEYLDKEAHRHINTDSDSELMLNIFANELNETGKARVNYEDIFAALGRMYKKCQGGWACTAMIAGYGLLAFRDANGIRPLLIGERPSETLPGATDYMLASESIALRQLGFRNIKDLVRKTCYILNYSRYRRPGQAVFLGKGCEPVFRQVEEPKSYTPDIFEYVYFARPDSILDGISVFKSRQQMGYKLADKIREILGEEGIKEIDAVIPIPETANTSAASVAESLKKPYSQGFVKNRYIFRTFIMPSQGLRQKGVRRKLSAIESEFAGRTVLLVDDSIVRGTTSKEIVVMAREAGAKKVIFASCAPRITNPHIYGIDLASPDELIASDRDRKAIAKIIDADDLDDLKAACAECSPEHGPKEFEVGVFCGRYVTPIPEGYFQHLLDLRGKKQKPTSAVSASTAQPVASSGPVLGNGDTGLVPNGETVRHLEQARRTITSPLLREDISLHNVAHDP
ncbi:amidophosphoribosyltransferase [Seiridium cupressi]